MVKTWLWIEGVPGSPKNNGWLDVISFSYGPQYQGSTGYGSGSSSGSSLSQDPSFTINYDNAAPVIVSKLVRGDIIDEIVLSIGPQRELHFYNSLITSAQTGGNANRHPPSFSFGIHYDKMEVQYSGSP
jgi:type VI protein secretion system component Hcp